MHEGNLTRREMTRRALEDLNGADARTVGCGASADRCAIEKDLNLRRRVILLYRPMSDGRAVDAAEGNSIRSIEGPL